MRNSKTLKFMNKINRHILKESDASMPDITWILENYDWKVDITSKEELGSDYYYHTLVTNEREAEKFNYHSDYWGDANTYQEEMVDLVSQIESYVGKDVIVDYDGDEVKCKVLGVLIDKQYNSLSHAKILVEYLNDTTENN